MTKKGPTAKFCNDCKWLNVYKSTVHTRHTTHHIVHNTHNMYNSAKNSFPHVQKEGPQKGQNVNNSYRKPEKKEPARFDMFTRRKKTAVAPVKDAKEVFTYRGDYYSQEPGKMISYLLGIIKNYRKQYAVMIIRDNTKPASSEDHTVLKLLNGQPVINRLPQYIDLIENISLPEYLSYEITQNG